MTSSVTAGKPYTEVTNNEVDGVMAQIRFAWATRYDENVVIAFIFIDTHSGSLICKSCLVFMHILSFYLSNTLLW